jgi:phage terminase Nu1 subunit (DNA packaging protein)
MDARDICRRLNCSPMTLSRWVEQGCPVRREPPFAHYVTEEVRQWLADNGITDWPKESDYDLDVPIRSILQALARKEITPWEAEKVKFNLGECGWGC